MKKIKYVSLVFALLFMLILSSCANNNALPAPSNLDVDIDDLLSWDEVANARTYQLYITGANDYVNDVKIRKNTYSLSKLEEGDYQIKIKAIFAGDGEQESDWSATYSFHKDYDPGILYELISDTEYMVISAGTAKGDVIIPEYYKGKPVTSIKDKAFKSNGRITSIVLPKTIKKIGDSSFYNCSNLVSITLSENLNSIGVAAFQSCRSLKEITIPNNIIEIPDSCFTYCGELKKVILPNTVKTIGEAAFADCKSLTDIDISNVDVIAEAAFNNASALKSITFGQNIKTITKSAFEGCASLENINFSINNNIDTIEARAFFHCDNLTTVNIPNGVVTISSGAFSKCSKLENVTISDTVRSVFLDSFGQTKLINDQINDTANQFIYVDKWLVGLNENYDGAALTQITATSFKAGTIGIAAKVFMSNETLESVTLPESVKYLCYGAFASCPKLFKFVSRENSLVAIEGSVFYYDSILSQVTLKTGLEEIGSYAFVGCTLLNNTPTLIPDTVKKIGAGAFLDTGLWSLPGEDNLIYAGNWLVGHKYMASSDQEELNLINDVVLKDNTIGIADQVFYKCRNLSSVTGSNRVRYIGSMAFAGCEKLIVISLNNNLKTIDTGAFLGCSGLYRINVPYNLEKVNDLAFYGCTSLPEFDMSEAKVSYIGDYAFAFCNSLKDIIFSDELTKIGSKAFYKVRLNDYVFNDGLEEIGDFAFYAAYEQNFDDGSLFDIDRQLDFNDKPATPVVNKDIEVVIPNSVTKIGKAAFAYTDIVKITLSNSLTKISDYTFYGCKKLKEVILNEGIKEIGEYAFMSTKLSYINLPKSLKKIGEGAFVYNDNLQNITLRDSIEEIGKNAFYGANSLVIYLESENANWDNKYNPSYRPVFKNIKYVDGTNRIESFVYKTNSMFQALSTMYFNAEGYKAVGFKYTLDGKEITASNILIEDLYNISNDTTIYIIWEEE